MKIHVYSLCWNERPMLPFYLRHYLAFADEIFIADDGSDDGSVEYLQQFPNVHVERFNNVGDSFVLASREYSNQCWKRSKGQADWVIICNVDEHIYHPDMQGYLEQAHADGVTWIPAVGYNMIADNFPDAEKHPEPLYELIRRGGTSKDYSKLAIFNPNEFDELEFSPGRHKLRTTGNMVPPKTVALKLLHYKLLGIDYVMARHDVLGKRLKEGDRRNNYGSHYFLPREDMLRRFEVVEGQAVDALAAKEYQLAPPTRP